MKRFVCLAAILVALGMVCLSPVSSLAAGKAVAAQVADTVSLNKATVDQLQALRGIGPALAERIVAYRTENGPFRTLEQLTQVKGIGERKLASFRDRLTLD